LDDARSRLALERLTLEVIDRIRSSCLELSEPELTALAKSMAILELKYLGQACPTLGERKPPHSKS
jgi:hypothetical protein